MTPCVPHEHGRAARQAGGDDDREHLRSEADSHGHGERQGLQTPAAQRRIAHQDQRRRDQHEPDQHPRDALHTAVEGARRTLASRTMHRCEPCVGPGGHHHADATARGDGAALEAQMGDGPASRHIHRLLGHGRRLAGQRRLLHGQATGPQQPQVGRDEVARRKPDHIAGNQVVDRDLAYLRACPGGCPSLHARGPRHQIP